MVLFVLCLFAEFIANDRPILVRYKGETYCCRSSDVSGEKFGGFLGRRPTIAIRHREGDRREGGWMHLAADPLLLQHA